MTAKHSRIVMAVGILLFAAATWFAFIKPEPPGLQTEIIMAASSTTSSTGNSSSSTVAISLATDVVEGVMPKNFLITFVTPTSSEVWVIGEKNTIQWSKPAGTTGQLYLVNAANGSIAGWVEQSLAPAQVLFPWDARNLFLSRTNGDAKDVAPGKYYLKLSFDSPEVPSAESAPFWIVASADVTTTAVMK